MSNTQPIYVLYQSGGQNDSAANMPTPYMPPVVQAIPFSQPSDTLPVNPSSGLVQLLLIPNLQEPYPQHPLLASATDSLTHSWQSSQRHGDQQHSLAASTATTREEYGETQTAYPGNISNPALSVPVKMAQVGSPLSVSIPESPAARNPSTASHAKGSSNDNPGDVTPVYFTQARAMSLPPTPVESAHGTTTNINESFHLNYAWRSLNDVPYERLPVGESLTVMGPNQRPPTELIPSEYILATKGAQVHFGRRGALCHCAHFHYNRACNFGQNCRFIHMVYVHQNARDGQFAPCTAKFRKIESSLQSGNAPPKSL